MTIVACIGLAVRDVIFTVDALPSGQGKVHALDRTEVGGGPAANAAVAIAALDGDARFVGALGTDELGDSIVAELEAWNVDTTRVRRLEGCRSPLSSVMVDPEGNRAIVNHTDRAMLAAALPPTGQDLQDASSVLVDVRWHDAALAGLRWARDNDVPGVVDYDFGDDGGADLLELASHVVFSAGALARLTGSSDPGAGLREAQKMSPAWLAVTLGEEGSLCLDGDTPRREPAFPVDVVDTTGAGDVYHGVFALELARGVGEAEAMHSASAAAALSCTRLGGRDGAPTRGQLNRFLEESR